MKYYNRYIGLDIHKKTMSWAMVKRDGSLMESGKISMSGLGSWAKRHLKKTDQVVIEASGNSYVVYDQLSPIVGEVVVANALAMHDRTRSKRKTDHVDAVALAEALASGYVAAVWVPSPADRQKREWASHRRALGEQVTSLRNQIRALLYRHGLDFTGKNVLEDAARVFVEQSSLPDLSRQLFLSKWRIGKALFDEIQTLDQDCAKATLADETALKLTTLPGIGPQAAWIITSAIGEIKRFEKPKQLARYAGLVPSVRKSAETIRYGPITKQGRSLLRWIMVEGAQASVLTPGPIRDRYQRLRRKGKPHNVAVVAVARHLLELVWHLLTKETVFHHARPRYLTVKMRGILRKAHGRCPINAAPTLAKTIMGWKTMPPLASA